MTVNPYIHQSPDGCVAVHCSKHGLLARICLGAEVFCAKCGRWFRTEALEIRQRRAAERDRKREQRAKAQLAA